jgi:hypothetical protein
MTERERYCKNRYKFYRWLFPLNYLSHNYYHHKDFTENKKQATCCICLEQHDYYYCTTCRVCKDGIICENCFDSYGDTLYDYSIDKYLIPPCPLCRTLFISDKIRGLIKGALSTYSVIPTSNNLYRRWIYNHMVSDDYLYWHVDDEAGYTHREYHLKVARDIKRIKVNKDLRNQIKKYNVKMAKKELKYKLKHEKWKIDEAQYDKLEQQKQLENEDKLKKLQNQNNQDIMFMQECGMDEYSNYDF